MKAVHPNPSLAKSAGELATKIARPAVDAAIVGNKVAEKMIEDVASAYEKYGVVDDNAVSAMFQRAVIGDADAPAAFGPEGFATEKSAISKMLARAKAAKPGDAPEEAQEAALAHIRTHYGDKMSTGASKTLDLVDRAQKCHRSKTPIPKELVDELKGSGAMSGGNASALAYIRKQYVSSIPPALMGHIDSMLNTWSMSLFQSGLEQNAEQARRQQEENARAFQTMLDADSATHEQVQRSHAGHVGKKHEIQFAKIDFDADKREIGEAKDDFEVGKEEVNEGDHDYASDMLAAAETSEDHAIAQGKSGGMKAGAWHSAMLNVRFPGTSRAG